IKHVDMLAVAGSVDKLLSSGCECVNDIRGLLGQPLILEDWAWQHFMTKNYATVADLLSNLGGGETQNEKIL
ncbi:MAG: phage portal protein, partial [Evtepia sp.]